MRLLLILLAILWIVAGVSLFMLTDASKKLLGRLLKRKNIKPISIIPLVLGIVLIRGASSVSMSWLIFLLGILAIAKGLFFIFGPEKKTKAFIDWWLNASNSVYKSWGIVAFLMGVLILLIL